MNLIRIHGETFEIQPIGILPIYAYQIMYHQLTHGTPVPLRTSPSNDQYNRLARYGIPCICMLS